MYMIKAILPSQAGQNLADVSSVKNRWHCQYRDEYQDQKAETDKQD
jgi:hypothetical protein